MDRHPRIYEQTKRKFRTKVNSLSETTKILTRIIRVNGWIPTGYMTYMSLNFRLFLLIECIRSKLSFVFARAIGCRGCSDREWAEPAAAVAFHAIVNRRPAQHKIGTSLNRTSVFSWNRCNVFNFQFRISNTAKLQGIWQGRLFHLTSS